MMSVFRENKSTYIKDRKPNKQEWLNKVLLAFNCFEITKAIELSRLMRNNHHPILVFYYFLSQQLATAIY